MDDETITAAQCKGARAMLNLSREATARQAGIAERTLIDFERGARRPLRKNLLKIQFVLEVAGIEFIPEDETRGPGVRLADL